MSQKCDGHEPDWAHKRKHQWWRPNWQDKIPHDLWCLGEVFFPIPFKNKGWNYAHGFEDNRYAADSEILNAYFDAGYGYGIACANDLAVIDIDDKSYVDDITSKLPDTLYQVTGSRDGVHLFYKCEGMNVRQILHYKEKPHECSDDDYQCWIDSDGECVKQYEWSHLGEVKCDPHGYVVGPGSVHPSGNRYGPLRGDSITSISKDDMMEALQEYIKPTRPDYHPSKTYSSTSNKDTRYDFYKLDADDVLPWLSPGKRIAHPVHGSETGSNFMKNSDGDTFTCWRHDYGSSQGCGLNAQQFLAVEATGRSCDDVRRKWDRDDTLHYRAWCTAVDKGFVGTHAVPWRVLVGYGISHGMIEKPDELAGQAYFDALHGCRYEARYSDVR